MTGYNYFLFAYSCFDVKKSIIVMITGIYNMYEAVTKKNQKRFHRRDRLLKYKL